MPKNKLFEQCYDLKITLGFVAIKLPHFILIGYEVMTYYLSILIIVNRVKLSYSLLFDSHGIITHTDAKLHYSK